MLRFQITLTLYDFTQQMAFVCAKFKSTFTFKSFKTRLSYITSLQCDNQLIQKFQLSRDRLARQKKSNIYTWCCKHQKKIASNEKEYSLDPLSDFRAFLLHQVPCPSFNTIIAKLKSLHKPLFYTYASRLSINHSIQAGCQAFY